MHHANYRWLVRLVTFGFCELGLVTGVALALTLALTLALALGFGIVFGMDVGIYLTVPVELSTGTNTMRARLSLVTSYAYSLFDLASVPGCWLSV